MAKLYELSDASWELIKDLVSPEQKMGRPRSDDRLVLHGILWILCSGAAWRDLPERFGPWSTVYQRFRDWRDDGASRIKKDRTFDQFIELDSDFWL
ncbi:ISPS1a [Pseudomonas tremae]|uniref:ISPS1a n=2 Tax=Pseudomonas syringae group TaxID=136849 RepID=A0AB37QQQ7_9PSED|nr:ISPS1a [Pseudomonas tremae]RMO04539.1 ISPS1a [Pseudomonas coronafaciens pv. zizaniae]RMS02554.1 ISPS1a [Pseudomonas coronafaciens pv. garcae]RMS06873.1 ISPS1a [Pseudomonas coronafaciens pv. garcae]